MTEHQRRKIYNECCWKTKEPIHIEQWFYLDIKSKHEIKKNKNILEGK